MPVVDEYLERVAAPQRAELERIRAIVKQVVPDAEEVITYAMPGFKYEGKYLIAYAPFKDHMSIFPGADPVGLLKDKLKDNITGKGTIQFTLDKPLAEDTIREIVALSVARVGARK
ncbi:MAG: hypothetical protein JWM00_635 [Candidatus Saccharibacteria bacterium]|nr:hypothetical protein [Candidatus Saccharibacteria bacterium]